MARKNEGHVVINLVDVQDLAGEILAGGEDKSSVRREIDMVDRFGMHTGVFLEQDEGLDGFLIQRGVEYLYGIFECSGDKVPIGAYRDTIDFRSGYRRYLKLK